MQGQAVCRLRLLLRKKGLNVIVLEKDDVFGGTTAFSGGVLWVPGNHHAKQNGIQDSREAALTYLKHETKEFLMLRL